MKKKIIKFFIKIIPFLLLIIYISACDDTKSTIPTVYVDFTIDINDPQYNDITIPGGYLYLTGGYSGILLYHSYDDTYLAFDRACPYDPDCGKLFVKKTLFDTVDSTCCKSEFSLLTGGNATKGPAKFPMKQYRCIYNAEAKIIQIKN